jgi:hypothetical protein
MTNRPIDPSNEIVAVASDLVARRALRDWAKDKPDRVRNLAMTIREQLRVLGRFGNAPGGDAVRSILVDNIKRLAVATQSA